MKEENILYQIKMLEKEIARLLLGDLKKGFTPPTPTQLQIMDYILNHQQETIYQKDLETVLSLRRATVSGVLQTMEKNHLIKRITDEEDSRQKRIILHENAKKCFKMRVKKAKEIEDMLTKDISKEEQIEFMKILKKMQKNAKERKCENA